MKKLLIASLLSASALGANAGSLHGGDWADIISVVVGAAGAAATGYANAQAAAQQQAAATPYLPQNGGVMVYYKSQVQNTDGTRTCLYDDSSWVVVRPGEDCVSYFER